MSDYVLQTAQEKFGIAYLYPWQRLVIENILEAAAESEADFAGERESPSRQIVLLPTGAGKSLCFMVPAAILRGPTLIFYPLLALMADQERRMAESGMECAVFRGGQSAEEREANFAKIKGGAKIILANPEVLQSERLVSRLSQCGIRHIAIDEAHCVAEWGDSFRPAYLTLGEIVKKIGCRTVTAFTATASPEVLSRVAEILFEGEAHIVRGETDRQNIRYRVRFAYQKEKEAARLAAECRKPAIIFCSSRRRCENFCSFLREFLQTDSVRFYHAGLSREEKTKIEKWFYGKSDAILVSTCAFGMGVDKKDIKTVIHLDAPATAEAYVQEAGRGGRDGDVADAILIWSPADDKKFANLPPLSRERVLFNFAHAKNPNLNSGRPDCRRQILLDALGGEEAVCAGCDICDGKADFFCEDENLILNFAFKRNRQTAFSEFLKDAENFFGAIKCGGLPFSAWERADVKNLAEEMLRQGKLRISGNILWRKTVEVTKKGKARLLQCGRQ